MSKTILITGGSRGIGAATSMLAARQGYHVAVNYMKNKAAAEHVVKQIESFGGVAVALQADVGVETDIVRMFEQLDKVFGRIDALVNNAGMLEIQSPVSKMSESRIARVFAVNSVGPFICCREAIKRMSIHSAGRGGAIVNVSSSGVKQGSPFEYVDYAASKAALETLTIGLAKEVAEQGIRVNAVRPGAVYTEIHASGGEPGRVDRVKDSIPMKRGGTPEEIAKAIMWLISDEASYCAGTILDVTGGK